MPSAPHHKAFHEFKQNLEYARQIVEGGRMLSRLQVGSFDVDDLYRAAWVQAVAALDHWVHEEIYHRAVVIAQQPSSTTKPKKFLSFEIPMGLFEEVSTGLVSLEAGLRSHLKKSLSYRSFQHPAKIKEGFALVTDLPLWEQVARVLTAQRSDGNRVTSSDLIDKLAKIANRRNKISHEADRNPDLPGAKMSIQADEVQDVIDLLETVGAAILETLDGGSAPTSSQSVSASPSPALQLQRVATSERAQRFNELLSRHQEEAPTIALLLERWSKLGGSITYSDRGEPSCLPMLDGEDFDYWAITIYPFTSKIHVTFDYLSQRPPFDDVALRRELLRRINAIPGVTLPDDSISDRPTFPIAALRGEGGNILWEALEWFSSQIPRE
ncbi:hypothetical protein [[Actinomadura] parvosata]|uniref:hypothetical protein n=1 Tax=[Actinomadura] parvosata TaxID=1955412 RepID=UPI0012BBA022|nr:hypothetical protein [Nonomuraea sp. ATCC 55076]